jgi:hypothetical protein
VATVGQSVDRIVQQTRAWCYRFRMPNHVWDRWNSNSVKSPAQPVTHVSRNMLPSDNVYAQALTSANSEYSSLGWAVRIAKCRMLTPGRLEIAFVVPGGPDDLQAGLDRLPRLNEVQSKAERCIAFAHHEVIPVYFTESMWDIGSPEWAYND